MGIEKTTLAQRIDLFAGLRHRMGNLGDLEFDELARRAENENNWFVPSSIRKAFDGICLMLEKSSLEQWCDAYNLGSNKPVQVGVVMAGNIPLVGFHDMLSVLISGHQLRIKPSSNDSVLMKWVVGELLEIEPGLKESISFEERLNNVDAIIATGSDNSARYFEYYFSKKPHIIRKNRTSCAILSGAETNEEIHAIGEDIFTYFGLGCRNISKLYLPRDIEMTRFLDGLNDFERAMDHHKYKNNYDYNKSIYLVNGDPHFDTGFLLLKESEDLVSPISVVFYEHYNNEKHLEQLITSQRDKLQCITGNHQYANVKFGQTQVPGVTDYADGVDTLKFLEDL